MKFSTSITVDGYTAYGSVPRGTPAENKANSVFCPLGPSPTRAWFLLDRTAARAIANTGGKHTVVWKTTGNEATTRTFRGLYLVKSERLEHGAKDDSSSLYLCEFVDSRGMAAKFSDTDEILANIRHYHPTSEYLTGTTGYTWTSLLTELWDACNFLGDFPAMPFAPDGVPQNYFFIGHNAWDALCEVLDGLDCAVKHDPLTNVYSIVQLGAAQAVGLMTSSLVTDFQPEGGRSLGVAATLRMWSYNYYPNYGQERALRVGTTWTFSGFAVKTDIATGLVGAEPETVKTVWDNLPRLLDEDNVITNQAAITARMEARKARYLLRAGVESAHRVHLGLQEIVPGGQVRAVLWRNWDDGDSNYFGGTVTEFVSGSDLVEGLIGGKFAYRKAETPPPAPHTQGDFRSPRRMLVSIGGDVSAANLVAPNSLTTINLPSIAANQAFVPMKQGANHKFVVQNESVTIFNPHPFTFGGSYGQLWVQDINGLWFIDKPEKAAIFADFTSSGFPPASSDATRFAALDGGSGSAVLGNYGIASVVGDTITIDAPVTDRPFRVTWQATTVFSVDDTTTFNIAQSIIPTGFTWPGTAKTFVISSLATTNAGATSGTTGVNSAGAPLHTHPFEILDHNHTSSFQGGTVSHTDTAICNLSQGDTIKIKSIITPTAGSVISHDVYGYVLIEPAWL